MQAQWFDGRSAKAHDVSAQISEHQLIVRGDQINNVYDTAHIGWPERTRTASRILRLPDGTTLHAPAGTDWHELASLAGVSDSTVVRWQQSWPHILLALVLLVGLGVGGYIWGVPLASKAVLAFVPDWVDKKIGSAFLDSIGDRMVSDTTLPESRQKQISDRFASMVKDSYPNGDAPDYELLFKKSKVGANAFALPGGYMIMTDELVELAQNDDMVLGVLAHELGHVTGRHGMRQVSQTLITGTLVALMLGDYADLIATVPLLIGQMAYSRDHEREADDKSIQMLLASNISPKLMADFFRKLENEHNLFKRPGKNNSPKNSESPKDAGDDSDQSQSGSKDRDDDDGMGIGIMISSHPATAERIEKFERAAQ